ncbi:winged helix-turn-helix transcriptional regulator [Actinomadura sp. HBU206391]|uniref:winged helix-turn-helix transcriptional regulator n=1 Tax=Actinomadura sp. HBU206391 TaxID=2731692 RepID=UPI00164FF9C7|nr:winged helix-turn-helix transcriptional regulator [Actinomadura sp. HBU206391]MBC6461677.1 transcriptional regulator [Actinomadura sp. HBU206391]
MSVRSYEDPCGIARSLDVIGERWALLVVRDLLLGPKRFNDLADGLPGVSSNVLSHRLRSLTEQGVVRRRDLGPPTRVHVYELTEWARELEPALLVLGRWGSRAPLPSTGQFGLDSLMLSIKASFDPATADELSGTYEFRIDTDTFVAEVAHGSVQIHRGTTTNPDATLTTDIATLRAVCNGQSPLPEAVRSGDLLLNGDQQPIDRMTHLLVSSFFHQGDHPTCDSADADAR